MSDELEDIQKEYAAYRKRARKDIRKAAERARAELARSLIGLVDDCDRAIQSVTDEPTIEGLSSLRKRTIARFEGVGLYPFCQEGDQFDAEKHEAIATHPSDEDSIIVEVHARGWRTRQAKVIRVATVTVSKAEACSNGTIGCLDNSCFSCLFEKEMEA